MIIKLTDDTILYGVPHNYVIETSSGPKNGHKVKSYFSNINQLANFLLNNDLIETKDKIMLSELPNLIKTMAIGIEKLILDNIKMIGETSE